MDKLVSVVIPVYNAEKYLKKCVLSVIEQSYKNIEVILVNDGSTDSSSIICRHFESIDNRISYIEQENSGPSVARNAGLEKSKGEYILFLDSDDFWILKDGLETLLCHPSLKTNDFTYLEFNRCRYIYKSDTYYKFPLFPSDLVVNPNQKQVISNLVKIGYFPVSACTKIIKRSFLIDNNIRFIPGLLSEDNAWFYEVLRKACGGIYFTNLYFYGNTADNQDSRSNTYSEKKVKDLFFIIEKEILMINESIVSEETKNAIYSTLAYKYLLIYIQWYHNHSIYKDDLSQKFEQFKWLLGYEDFPKVKKINKIRSILGHSLACAILYYIVVYRDIIKSFFRL